MVEHRRNYRKYKEACIQSLQRPNDTELKLDLQKYEDSLTILNIVIAREHARQELRNKDIERECQIIASSPSKDDVSVESVSTNNDEVQSAVADHSKSDSQKSSVNLTENSSSPRVKLEKTLKQIGKHFQTVINTYVLIIIILLHYHIEKSKTKSKFPTVISYSVRI